MTEQQLKKLMSDLDKSRKEFDIATTCVAQALQSMCERLEKVELWILENQRKQQEQ